jgi:hypothetical protein
MPGVSDIFNKTSHGRIAQANLSGDVNNKSRIISDQEAYNLSGDEGYDVHSVDNLSDNDYMRETIGENQEWSAIPHFLGNLGAHMHKGSNALEGVMLDMTFSAMDSLGLMKTVDKDGNAIEMSQAEKNLAKNKFRGYSNIDSNEFIDDDIVFQKHNNTIQIGDMGGSELGSNIATSAAYVYGLTPMLGATGAVAEAGVAGLARAGASVAGTRAGVAISTALTATRLGKTTVNLINNPAVKNILSGLITGTAESRAIGGINAQDTFQETFNDSIEQQRANYIKTYRLNNRLDESISDEEIANTITKEQYNAFDSQAIQDAEKASNIVKSMSWWTGALNIGSTAQLLGKGNPFKNWSGLNPSRAIKNTSSYFKENALGFFGRGVAETVEETIESGQQKYAKETTLSGGDGKGYGDRKFWKTMYDTAFSTEGLQIALSSIGTTGMFQAKQNVSDIYSGRAAEQNKEHKLTKEKIGIYKDLRNQVSKREILQKELSVAKTEDEKNRIALEISKLDTIINQSKFFKDIVDYSNNLSLATEISNLAEDSGLLDISKHISEVAFAKSLKNSFDLGLGEHVEDIVKTLTSGEVIDDVNKLHNLNGTQDAKSNITKRAAEIRSLVKDAEKVYNDVYSKGEQSETKSKILYNLGITKKLAEKEHLRLDIEHQSALQKVLKDRGFSIDTESFAPENKKDSEYFRALQEQKDKKTIEEVESGISEDTSDVNGKELIENDFSSSIERMLADKLKSEGEEKLEGWEERSKSIEDYFDVSSKRNALKETISGLNKEIAQISKIASFEKDGMLYDGEGHYNQIQSKKSDAVKRRNIAILRQLRNRLGNNQENGPQSQLNQDDNLGKELNDNQDAGELTRESSGELIDNQDKDFGDENTYEGEGRDMGEIFLTDEQQEANIQNRLNQIQSETGDSLEVTVNCV